MAKAKKRCGEIVARIVKRESRDLVGYLYEWNTGERQNGWFNGPVADVVLEELTDDDKDQAK